MAQTIAQQLNVKELPFTIKDKNGNVIYQESQSYNWLKDEYRRNWVKYQYNFYGKKTYCEYSNGNWVKLEYDANGYITRHETSNGYWGKYEYDTNGKEIYFENSKGEIIDKRSKQVELTLDEIATKFGVDVNQLKIKK